jgi:hypothetical protein
MPGLGLGHPVPQPGLCRRRRQGLPGFRGTPMHACPALRPRRALGARPLRRFGAAFRLLNDVGTHEEYFGAPSHSLRALCVRFAARVAPGPRNTRFRLVANHCRAGFTRWVPLKSFRSRSYMIIPPSRTFLAHEEPLREPVQAWYPGCSALLLADRVREALWSRAARLSTGGRPAGRPKPGHGHPRARPQVPGSLRKIR